MRRGKKSGKGKRVNKEGIRPPNLSHPLSIVPQRTLWVRLVEVVKRNKTEIKTLLFRFAELAIAIAIQQIMMG